MKIQNVLISALFLLLSFSRFSQVKVTSYSVYSLGISVPVKEKFNAELKAFTIGEVLKVLALN